jgi:hypothetical protein
MFGATPRPAWTRSLSRMSQADGYGWIPSARPDLRLGTFG